MKKQRVLTCKYCGKQTVLGQGWICDSALVPLSHVVIIAHAVSHHWDTLTPKARLLFPVRLLWGVVSFVFFELLDVCLAAVWLVTWPFWWLHEILDV